MKIIHCALLGIATLVPLFAGTSVARADHENEHLENLSERLHDNVDEVIRELSRNHREQPGFKETYREAKQMHDLADDIHDALDDRRPDVRRLRRDVEKLDELMHHVQRDVNNWSRVRYVAPYRPSGFPGGISGGHHGGFNRPPVNFAPTRRGNTQNLLRRLAEMEDTMHHLHEDLFDQR